MSQDAVLFIHHEVRVKHADGTTETPDIKSYSKYTERWKLFDNGKIPMPDDVIGLEQCKEFAHELLNNLKPGSESVIEIVKRVEVIEVVSSLTRK